MSAGSAEDQVSVAIHHSFFVDINANGAIALKATAQAFVQACEVSADAAGVQLGSTGMLYTDADPSALEIAGSTDNEQALSDAPDTMSLEVVHLTSLRELRRLAFMRCMLRSEACRHRAQMFGICWLTCWLLQHVNVTTYICGKAPGNCNHLCAWWHQHPLLWHTNSMSTAHAVCGREGKCYLEATGICQMVLS